MNRSLLVISQIVVVLLAIAVRMLAPGWWFVIIIMSFGLVAAISLAPLLLAAIMATVFAPSLRPHTLVTLVVADLAALSFALTMTDFTDQSDDHLVPLAALVTGDGNVSASAASIFDSVAGWSCIVGIVAGIAVAVLSVVDHVRAGRADRARQFLTPAVG